MGSVVIVTSLIIEEGTKPDRCVLTIGLLVVFRNDGR